MSFQTVLIICGLVLAGVSSLPAQTPFKSVDQSGNVTYSDKKPVDAVTSSQVEIPAAPTEQQIQDSEERARKAIEQAEQAQSERDEEAEKRAAERREAEKREAAQRPQVIVIDKGRGYPSYYPPLISKPPGALPPGNAPEHPIYTPPGIAPPIARPLPSLR